MLINVLNMLILKDYSDDGVVRRRATPFKISPVCL